MLLQLPSAPPQSISCSDLHVSVSVLAGYPQRRQAHQHTGRERLRSGGVRRGGTCFELGQRDREVAYICTLSARLHPLAMTILPQPAGDFLFF